MSKAKAAEAVVTYTDDAGNTVIAFRKPTYPEYLRLIDQFGDDKTSDSQAMVTVVKTCSLFDVAQTQAFLDEWPAAIPKIATALQEASEPSAKLVVKKG